MNRILVVMAKAPRAGSVKTRLAGSFPAQAVTELYECFLADTLALARKLKRAEVVFMCPAADVRDLRRALGRSVRVVPQPGQGLAASLARLFERFAGREGRRFIAFGTDSPHLPVRVLEAAFDALGTCDLVAGPTHDGGYYLIGAKASHPGLFVGDGAGMGMGTGSALDALLTRARALGLTVHLTDPFYDIDVAADLSRLAKELQRTPARAPRTAKWLSERARPETKKSL